MIRAWLIISIISMILCKLAEIKFNNVGYDLFNGHAHVISTIKLCFIPIMHIITIIVFIIIIEAKDYELLKHLKENNFKQIKGDD